jgi:hypothetical protein
MKTIKQFIICTLVLGTSVLFAQDVKHQSDMIRGNVSKGDFKIIADQYGSSRGRMEITEVNQDQAQPNGHYEIVLKEYPDSERESTRNESIQLFADNIAFPVTYIRSVYEGNAKLQDKVGYVIREGRSVGSDRVVFIDNYLFILHNWQNKDNYEIRYVLKSKSNATDEPTEKGKKKKKKGFFKAMKEGMKNMASGGVSIENLKTTVLQPYLDKATEKQSTFYATWIKDADNAKTVKFMDDKRKMMTKAMKQYNDDIFNSPEYQRMLAYHRWLDSNINVTVYNKSNSTIWVGSTKEAFITTKIEPGGDSVQTCTTDMYYYYSDAKGSPGTKFYNADAACGSSVTIN